MLEGNAGYCRVLDGAGVCWRALHGAKATEVRGARECSGTRAKSGEDNSGAALRLIIVDEDWQWSCRLKHRSPSLIN